MNRLLQLCELETSLVKLIEILKLDPKCQWLRHFESCLAQARILIQAGAPQSELNELSSSVIHVFGGMGSFNDYAPAKYNPDSRKYSVILGAEGFEEIAGQVYDQALGLRLVGSAL